MKNLMNNKQKIYPYLIAIGIFILLTFVYLSPVLKGYEINAGDVNSWKGMSKELADYKEKTGASETANWTNSMFSGMPSFSIYHNTQVENVRTLVINFLGLGLNRIMMLLFGYLVGFFILLKAFRVNTWLSAIGAIGIALSSYFLIIIEAGHMTKAGAIGYSAGIIAGFYLIFRNKNYIIGALCTMLFTALAFPCHIQMVYYYFLMIGVFFLTEIYIHIKEKVWKSLLISTAVFLFSIGIGIGTNAEYLMTNQSYLKHTMRGGHSELTTEGTGGVEKKSAGLDLDYATQWSYGIDETFTLLIPNFKGGSSHGSAGNNSETYKALVANGYPKSEASRINEQLPMYWGSQPFTSGPVYVGAIIVFLFVLGLYVVRTPYKWALLIVTIFSILLSWGKNMMWLTELFMNYFPYYNKFRAVSSILVIAEVAMPLLGLLALNQIFTDKDKSKYLSKIKWSFVITGGICLFFVLFGRGIYNFEGAEDAQYLGGLAEFVQKDRASLFTMDCLRSFIFILLAAVVLWFYAKGKLKNTYFLILLGSLILVDLWMVDKRYFNNDDFFPKKQFEKQFVPTEADRQIMSDTDIHYRVLNFATNTFNDAHTSYFHKSVGGYSAAKLSRYQDMIEHHIAKQNMQVLNMLNTKYFIIPDQKTGSPVVQYNAAAFGNAWFVDSLTKVGNPNEEIEALNYIQISNTAVIDTNLFGKAIAGFQFGQDSGSAIKLLSYTPDELRYKAVAKNAQNMMVFSEVYYPDWFATVDGKPVDVFRVNYILRAIIVPKGEHEIVLRFRPHTVEEGVKISIAFWIFISVFSIGAIIFSIVQYNKKTKKNKQ